MNAAASWKCPLGCLLHTFRFRLHRWYVIFHVRHGLMPPTPHAPQVRMCDEQTCMTHWTDIHNNKHTNLTLSATNIRCPAGQRLFLLPGGAVKRGGVQLFAIRREYPTVLVPVYLFRGVPYTLAVAAGAPGGLGRHSLDGPRLPATGMPARRPQRCYCCIRVRMRAADTAGRPGTHRQSSASTSHSPASVCEAGMRCRIAA